MNDVTNCDENKKQVIRPCRECGAPIPWGPQQPRYLLCKDCIASTYGREHKKTQKQKEHHAERNKQWVKETGYCGKAPKDYGYPTRKLKIDFLDKPCFFCDYYCCSGSRKEIVCITGKTMYDELGYKKGIDKIHIPIKDLAILKDSNRFLIMCQHHSIQYRMLRQWHPLWLHEQIIEKMVRRMTPEVEKDE